MSKEKKTENLISENQERVLLTHKAESLPRYF